MFQVPNSQFYGYSNGDLLFDNGLPGTLVVLDRFLPQTNRTLVIGKRTNIKLMGRVLYKPTDVRISAKRGRLFRADAEDYFFIAHNSFPWEKVPEIVIGRPAYDNFMVGMAIKNEVSAVDVTKTMVALHQTGKDGDYAGHKNSDKSHNFKSIGKFNWGSGLTSSAQFETEKDHRGNILLYRRSNKKKNISRQRLTTPAVPIVTTLPVTVPTSKPTVFSKQNVSLITTQPGTKEVSVATNALNHTAIQFLIPRKRMAHQSSANNTLTNSTVPSTASMVADEQAPNHGNVTLNKTGLSIESVN